MNATTFAKYASDPATFRAELLVDVDGSVRRFGDVMDPWQRDDFAALDPGLMRCNGRGNDADAKMRAYLERPRGHSKTTDLAVTCTWALAFATRPIRGHCFAADADQAALLKNAVEVLIRLNPWLARILSVQKNQVLNIAEGHPGKGGTLEIYSSSVATSYGLLSDLLICDELTHHEGDGSLFHSILSTAAKRTNCLLAVISNAGMVDSWQYKIRQAAISEPGWYFSRLEGPQASWMTPARLEEQRRMLPAIAFGRLWLNNWSSGGGDALSPETIDRAFKDGLAPMEGKSDDWFFIAGCDLGLTRDCAAVVTLAVPQGGKAGKIRLAANKLWKPLPGKKINLLEVERYILNLDAQFGLEFVAFDPWQAEHLAQTLEADTGHRRRNSKRLHWTQPWCREIPPTPTNLRLQATTTIESFNDSRVHFYPCEPLHRDLHKLRVEEKSYGFRLTSPRDGEGHGDTFSAFALALLIANEVAGKKTVTAGLLGVDSASPDDYWARRLDEYQREQDEMNAPYNQADEIRDAQRSGSFTMFGSSFFQE